MRTTRGFAAALPLRDGDDEAPPSPRAGEREANPEKTRQPRRRNRRAARRPTGRLTRRDDASGDTLSLLPDGSSIKYIALAVQGSLRILPGGDGGIQGAAGAALGLQVRDDRLKAARQARHLALPLVSDAAAGYREAGCEVLRAA